MKRLLLWAAMLLPGIAAACYNDRDTLGYELHNKPDLQRALTGRFDRFPPLYYSMRVDRLRAKTTLAPKEYDDLAVALDRQGKSEEALAAIEAKGKLAGLTADDKYRFFANRGTIRAHRWLRDAARQADVSELRGAAEDIAMALKLNPKAHFGREGTQLEVIRWIIDVKKSPKNAESLGYWLAEKMDTAVDVPKSLAGLTMLGAAWESPDTAFAIAQLEVELKHSSAIAGLALARYKELLADGKKCFIQAANDEAFIGFRDLMTREPTHGEPSVAERFVQLRKEADEWHRAKTAYMLERLRAGRHPDTDPQFWAEWKESPMPSLPLKVPQPYSWPQALIVTAIVASGAAVCLMILRRMRRVKNSAVLGA